MKQVTKDVNRLKENDIINILLFSIYKLSDDPEYSAISDLIYVLDKDSLLKLCSIYGGCTIKIPTLAKLKLLTKTLVVIQAVNFDGLSLDKAFELAEIEQEEKDDILFLYNKVVDIINEYETN